MEDFAFELTNDGTYKITSGTPTWEGFDLARCERLLNDIGPRAFLVECQHEVKAVEGAISTEQAIDATRRLKAPSPAARLRTIVTLDPPVTATERSDEFGITVQTLADDRHVYLLEDLSCRRRVEEVLEIVC